MSAAPRLAITLLMMQIHNTLGRETVPFTPIIEGKVGMYVCGATVQSKPHLGHGRYAVAFDVIRRYLMSTGLDVTYVRNVTDVEDKIIHAANEQGIGTDVLVAESKESFDAAYEALGVLPPDIEPFATEHIPEMISHIEALMASGAAYAADGDVYFRVREFPSYGKLSGRNVDDLMSGARVATSLAKEDPLDFALWKGAKAGEPAWDSPWGPGRPGWHIECSAMARKHLGDTFDIHGAGADLIFPHHENEIAQTESLTHKPLAHYWLHNGMVTMGGEKMSKSTGLVYGLNEALDLYPPLAVRLFYLRAQYRSPLEYSVALLEDASAAYERLSAFLRRTKDIPFGEPDQDVMSRFGTAMEDDFNTPVALSVLFDSVRTGNQALDDDRDAVALVAAVKTILEILGLVPGDADFSDIEPAVAEVASQFGAPTGTVDEMVSNLLGLRATARQSKDWATSDAIRDALSGLGIVMEDTADGIRWHRQ